MPWVIEFAASASRQLGKLGHNDAERVLQFLRTRIATADNARSIGKALRGPLGDFWRYRVGDIRLVCDIQDHRLVVLVLTVGRRDTVYKRP
ncbi:type II toxin-antitoxin system RelE family toxin [Chiayiivirga flava]|uniref:mRNA interferase RelE/StbE n=1 Tax=Chiayiivirga flava TaxID=659595 RepID=A0A7W8G0E9_9GAMM|nr:type II toxin-antitoxin system RelE/ParE family toxin [Chiayiivirga flava]MBB5207668.1 mRNA interferase RelE/StbE [Chiayiivirga flava]